MTVIDSKGNFVGFSNTLLKEESFINTPPLPIYCWDSAVWDGVKWNYKFKGKEKNLLIRKQIAAYEIIRIISQNLTIRGGNKIHEKTGGVSVLIPCYGKSKWIKDTVLSAVNQTMKAEQIIVLLMDSASQRMANELESLSDNIRCIISPKMNVCKARNHLVEVCPTEHFVFLDGDDILLPKYIERVWSFEANVVFTRCFNCDNGVIKERIYSDEQTTDAGLAIGQNPTALWSKTIFNELGGFDENFKEGLEDTDLIIRLLQSNWKCQATSEVLYRYNINLEGSLTSKSEFCLKAIDLLNKNLYWYRETIKKNIYLTVEGSLTEFLKKDHITLDDCENFYNNYISGKQGMRCKYLDTISEKFRESMQRIPICSYEKESNSFETQGNLPKDFPFINLYGFSFDVVFIDKNDNTVDSENFIINKTILPQLEELNLTGQDKVNWLLENYCCLFLSTHNNTWPTDSTILDFSGWTVFPEDIEDFYYGIKVSHKYCCTFVLDKKCNLNCIHCHQKNDKDRDVSLSDDEWYGRFNLMLSVAEENLKNQVHVQIMGGEPSLWSDYLVSKIQQRLSKYNGYTIFTNGANRDSLWFKDSKAIIFKHIVDWEKMEVLQNDYETQSTKNILVVSPSNVHLLKNYLDLNKHIKNFLINPTNSQTANKDVCGETTIREIARICEESSITPNILGSFVKGLDEKGIEYCRESCRNKHGVIQFNCTDMTVSPCNSLLNKRIPIIEWKKPEYDCKGCLWLCQRVT